MTTCGKSPVSWIAAGFFLLLTLAGGTCSVSQLPIGDTGNQSPNGNQDNGGSGGQNDDSPGDPSDADGDGIPDGGEPAWLGDPLTPHASIPAFPGASGFGGHAFGGRGDGSITPRIIAVTTLQDRILVGGQYVAAPGSLREAVEASGPRFVIFNVYGTIFLDVPLVISNPFITIAGQTAGGDGIALAHWGIQVRTHDVVLRHLRIRVLYEESDGLNGRYMDGLTALKNDYEISGPLDTVYNLMIDHCSFSWAVDECLDFWNWVRNYTVQWCIISNGATYGHEKGEHGSGLMSGPQPGGLDDGTSSRGTLHHNLIGHHKQRSPLLTGGHTWDLRNNVIYNWYYWDPVELVGAMDLNFVGNYLIAGLDVSTIAIARNAARISTPGSSPHARIFLHDNMGPLRAFDAQSQWDVGIAYRVPNVNGLCGFTSSQCTYHVGPSNFQSSVELTQSASAPPVDTQPVAAALASVLAGAGATRPRRDTVDGDFVAEIQHVLNVGGAAPGDPQLGRLGPHHGPTVDVLRFLPNGDPNYLCVPRQRRLDPGEDLNAAKMVLLSQMNCTLPGGYKLPEDAAVILANPISFPFDVVQRVIPDRATVNSFYADDANPPLPLDTDGDGIPDSAEAAIGSSPTVHDSLLDADGDGYLNIEEYLNSL